MLLNFKQYFNVCPLSPLIFKTVLMTLMLALLDLILDCSQSPIFS